MNRTEPAMTHDIHHEIHSQQSGAHVAAFCVQVYILDNPFCIDKPYTYLLPWALQGRVQVGSFVMVPFGKSNRKLLALVVGVDVAPPEENGIKPVYAACSDRLVLSHEQMGLCMFLKEQTLCTVGDAVRTLLPSMAMAKLVPWYVPVSTHGREDLQQKLVALSLGDQAIYGYLCAKGRVSHPTLVGKYGRDTAQESISRLVDAGLAEKALDMEEPQVPTVTYVHLSISRDEAQAIVEKQAEASLKLRSPMQIEILRRLMQQSPLQEAVLLDASGAKKAHVTALEEKGLVDREEIEKYGREQGQAGERPPFDLSEEQALAVDTLEALANTGEAKAALLHGVTGSGKTCVMLSMIDKMLDRDKGVIVLLPEIALTPHIQDLFTARYGGLVAVVHSALTPAQRKAVYDRAVCGHAKVVIGTRSAVFTPVQNLGMIVIDEEQEHTYKSDMNPKYHARDIARFRCAYHKALMLLASATPSLESYYKAEEGKYTLIKLKNRYGNAVLPTVEMVDMRGEITTSPLSSHLCQALTNTWQAGEQSVLFLNRRGYSTQVVCRSCGQAVRCPNCSVALNFHTSGRDYTQGVLVCHLCGTRQPYPQACPECGSVHMVRMGYGTQRLEEELSKLLPRAKVLRMDADTMSKKEAYENLLSAFRNQEAEVLFGTQMVTKGHDFPHVTLVGVLLADASLYLDDYRAGERTFDMLTQVIGRAGRGDQPGVAVIQTMNPDNDMIKLACAQDYETFYQREIRLRKLLVFPPYCDMVIMTLSCRDEKLLQKSVVALSELWQKKCGEDYADVPVISFGPFEAPVYRVDKMYRMRMVVKCRLNKRSRSLFAEMLSTFSSGGGRGERPILSIDFNPSYL